MTVIAFDIAPDAVRGEMTRWFLELKPGVFVGRVNSRIRDLLWDRLCAGSECRGVVMMYSDRNEQGYSLRMHGQPKRKVLDLEGVQLICRVETLGTTSRDEKRERDDDIYIDRTDEFMRTLLELEEKTSEKSS